MHAGLPISAPQSRSGFLTRQFRKTRHARRSRDIAAICSRNVRA
jgi:hypothetical protein